MLKLSFILDSIIARMFDVLQAYIKESGVTSLSLKAFYIKKIT